MPDPVVVVPPVDPNASKPWFEGKLDAEGVGYLQNRGLHDKPIETVALETIKAHREATKLIGVPQNELIRVPKDAKDEAGWKALHQRLGAPADAKDYDFSTVKDATDKPINAALADAIRASAFTRGLSKEAAVDLATSVQKQLDANAQAAATEKQVKVEEQKKALKDNWKAGYDANMVIAKNAAAALKITEVEVNALEGVIGYDRVMELMRSIGTRIGEDKFLRPDLPGGGGLLTKEQAIEKKAMLLKDAAWSARYMAGGVPENRELQDLLKIIVGDDTEASRRS